jgi:dephospho-CoA kinase
MTGPRVWGITGSIGMGKTTVAGQFSELGVPVFCSDDAVHQLMEEGGKGVDAVARLYPQAVEGHRINRDVLAKCVLGKPEKLNALEEAVHPLVREMQEAFIHKHYEAPLVLLDIPLLFETGAEARLDGVVVVTAPETVQRERVLARANMTQEKLEAILARQMPDVEKRQKADWVIDSSQGLRHSMQQVKQALKGMKHHA